MPILDAPVVLITGGLSDIGRATAQAFAQAGYTIVVNYRRQAEQAVAFTTALKQQWHAPEAIAISADVRSRTDVQSLYEQIDRTLGRVDVLVNNAGLNRDKPLLDMTDEEWDTVITTVLTGTFMCSQEFARRYTGTDGNIINLGAVTAIKGRKNGVNYCSARAGVLTLTKCLALELAPRIRVNVVTPGRIDTAELQTRYRLDDERNRQRLEQDVPLQKLGKPADVAAMIVFLVTAGQYITGQNFFVDGGLFMR
jgi:acetoacetyl-CoA reductase/3-oxoacyl-[acyl-carrier protein] reductase